MNKLHKIGVYIPGMEGNEEKALEFWGRVFNWGTWDGKNFIPEKATSRHQQLQRKAQVEGLLEHLVARPNLVCFSNNWYNNNRSTAYGFFSAVQMLLGELKIRYRVVKLDAHLKAFTWEDPL